jgi:hypothetical protein
MKKEYSKLDIEYVDIETNKQYADLSDTQEGDNGIDFPWPTA